MTKKALTRNSDAAADLLLSDQAPPQRPVAQMMKIDRIDDHGDIREHWTINGQRTLCGIAIGLRQAPCGNRPCKRCEKIVVRLSEIAGPCVNEMKVP